MGPHLDRAWTRLVLECLLLHGLGTWHMPLPKPGIAFLANIFLGEFLVILQNPIQLSLHWGSL